MLQGIWILNFEKYFFRSELCKILSDSDIVFSGVNRRLVEGSILFDSNAALNGRLCGLVKWNLLPEDRYSHPDVAEV